MTKNNKITAKPMQWFNSKYQGRTVVLLLTLPLLPNEYFHSPD